MTGARTESVELDAAFAAADVGDAAGRREVERLLDPRTVRERAEEVYAAAATGALEHWTLDESRLDDVVSCVERVTRAAYPDVRQIPYHGRLRHFGAGGVDRVARFEAAIAARPDEERLASRFELIITSVLLDAGAGDAWSYRDAAGGTYARSEGLAVASYDLFSSGGLSADRDGDPLRADASALEQLDASALARAFQVTPENPLVGLDGRAALLRKLGEVVRTTPAYFGESAPRLGNLGVLLSHRATRGEVRARDVLGALLRALGPIWPGRESIGGTNLGDVWRHGTLGLVPFHKLSQWLTYSLCEPLEVAGLRVIDLGDLTGLAEYRNGGLFVDAGVLVPRHEAVLTDVHAPSSDVIIEWRALTIALLDRTATGLRARLGLSVEELPLARVLEGGTWRAGREIAAEMRPGGPPPLRIQSDGTVF